MSKAAALSGRSPDSLAERFWSIARARGGSGVDGDSVDPVKVTRHVLAILDALDRGERGAPVSVRTVSFLKLLRESEQRGDLSYAAPEQISGEVLDERSLVFSVGVLLFERLTGRHPFGAEGNHPRRVARIRKGEFGSGVNYFPTVPQGLRSIIMRAMGPFPEERWNTLAELRSHLEQFVDQEAPEVVRLPGTSSDVDRTPPAKRRHPKSDRESTRVVDMSDQVRIELAAAAEKQRRASQETSGLIEVDDEPADAPVPAPRVEVTPAPAVQPAPQPPPSRPAMREADLLPELPPTPYEPNLQLRSPSKGKPLLWALGGAAAATVAFLLLSSGSSGDANPAAGSAATATEKAAAPADPEQPATPEVTPMAADEPEEKKTVPAVFDPEREGERALAVGLPCLTASQKADGVAFGIGILYDGDASRVRKVYFAGKDSELPWKQRQCMQRRLGGMATLAAPTSTGIVQYYARIRGEEIRVKVQE